MNDQVDDVDDFDDDFDDGGFDDLNDQSNTLGDLWRNNPLVKIGAILIGLALLVGGIILFGGQSDPINPSRLRGAQDVSQAPGSDEISDTMRQAIEEENVRRVEEAQRTGQSALPMDTSPPKGTIGLQVQEEDREDPLARWRRMQERRIQEQQFEPQPEPAAPPPPPPPDTKTPAINALAEAMATQMASILENQPINGARVIPVGTIQYLEALEAREQEQLQLQLAQQQANLLQGEEIVDELDILLPAGSIEYAQIVTAVSTDAPGPVLAEIATGPLQGARAIGTFTEERNFLVLNFNTFVLDGVDYAASAVALDPNTTLPGVVTNIDRRYLTRIILPAAAEFVEGFAEALAESNTTTNITINSDGSTTQTTDTGDIDPDEAIADGVEGAGEEISEALQEIASSTRPLLEIAAGTPIGILFTSPVVDQPNVLRQRDQERFDRQLQQQQSLSGRITNSTPLSSATVSDIVPFPNQ